MGSTDAAVAAADDGASGSGRHRAAGGLDGITQLPFVTPARQQPHVMIERLSTTVNVPLAGGGGGGVPQSYTILRVAPGTTLRGNAAQQAPDMSAASALLTSQLVSQLEQLGIRVPLPAVPPASTASASACGSPIVEPPLMCESEGGLTSPATPSLLHATASLTLQEGHPGTPSSRQQSTLLPQLLPAGAGTPTGTQPVHILHVTSLPSNSSASRGGASAPSPSTIAITMLPPPISIPPSLPTPSDYSHLGGAGASPMPPHHHPNGHPAPAAHSATTSGRAAAAKSKPAAFFSPIAASAVSSSLAGMLTPSASAASTPANGRDADGASSAAAAAAVTTTSGGSPPTPRSARRALIDLAKKFVLQGQTNLAEGILGLLGIGPSSATEGRDESMEDGAAPAAGFSANVPAAKRPNTAPSSHSSGQLHGGSGDGRGSRGGRGRGRGGRGASHSAGRYRYAKEQDAPLPPAMTSASSPPSTASGASRFIAADSSYGGGGAATIGSDAGDCYGTSAANDEMEGQYENDVLAEEAGQKPSGAAAEPAAAPAPAAAAFAPVRPGLGMLGRPRQQPYNTRGGGGAAAGDVSSGTFTPKRGPGRPRKTVSGGGVPAAAAGGGGGGRSVAQLLSARRSSRGKGSDVGAPFQEGTPLFDPATSSQLLQPSCPFIASGNPTHLPFCDDDHPIGSSMDDTRLPLGAPVTVTVDQPFSSVAFGFSHTTNCNGGRHGGMYRAGRSCEEAEGRSGEGDGFSGSGGGMVMLRSQQSLAGSTAAHSDGMLPFGGPTPDQLPFQRDCTTTTTAFSLGASTIGFYPSAGGAAAALPGIEEDEVEAAENMGAGVAEDAASGTGGLRSSLSDLALSQLMVEGGGSPLQQSPPNAQRLFGAEAMTSGCTSTCTSEALKLPRHTPGLSNDSIGSLLAAPLLPSSGMQQEGLPFGACDNNDDGPTSQQHPISFGAMLLLQRNRPVGHDDAAEVDTQQTQQLHYSTDHAEAAGVEQSAMPIDDVEGDCSSAAGSSGSAARPPSPSRFFA